MGEEEVTSILEEADSLIETNPEAAIAKYDEILLAARPNSARAIYGKAKALDSLAENRKSNALLEQAITLYQDVLSLGDQVPAQMYLEVGLKCVERMQFRGWNSKAVRVLKAMLKRLPHETVLLNQLGTQFLLLGQNKAAGEMFEAVLVKEPRDNYASLHLGFVLKTGAKEDELERAVKLLRTGIDGSKGTADGKFYYHLGQGLVGLGRHAEADELYKRGASLKKFLSFWQRSLYNVEGITAKPVWSLEETGQAGGLLELERHWKEIRDEGLRILKSQNSSFEDETENLRESGDWQQLELLNRGVRRPGCTLAPRTCSLVEAIPAVKTCKRGQAKFSVMFPGTRVRPHSGPTNCRLRAHLGLEVPPPPGDLKMRVADKFLEWKNGKIFVFDDSFDHEVWHERKSFRLVLIVDMWHPELDGDTRVSLTPI